MKGYMVIKKTDSDIYYTKSLYEAKVKFNAIKKEIILEMGERLMYKAMCASLTETKISELPDMYDPDFENKILLHIDNKVEVNTESTFIIPDEDYVMIKEINWDRCHELLF